MTFAQDREFNYWRQSHNWTKRMDDIARLDLRRNVASFGFDEAGKLSVDLVCRRVERNYLSLLIDQL